MCAQICSKAASQTHCITLQKKLRCHFQFTDVLQGSPLIGFVSFRFSSLRVSSSIMQRWRLFYEQCCYLFYWKCENVNNCLKIHRDIWEVKTGAFVIEVCWIHIGTDWFYQDNQHAYTHTHTETICLVVYRPHCLPSKWHDYLFKIYIIADNYKIKDYTLYQLFSTPCSLFICQFSTYSRLLCKEITVL